MAKFQLTTSNKMTLRRTSRRAIIDRVSGKMYLQETVYELTLPSVKYGLKRAWQMVKDELFKTLLPMPAVA